MCTVCGCGEPDTSQERNHHHEHNFAVSQEKIVQLETDILEKNNLYAGQNRDYFNKNTILALNLVSSPGSGKTSILETTIAALNKNNAISVIEGDQQSSQDTARIKKTGAKAIQINTGKACHLDAHMVVHAITNLKPKNNSVVFIENVGNLVCPAAFDLGEYCKVVILSVTEGDDKPLKYPDMFVAADLILLNKTDLLPYVNFDVDKCLQYAREINPKIKAIQTSATTNDGMDKWYKWLEASHNTIRALL